MRLLASRAGVDAYRDEVGANIYHAAERALSASFDNVSIGPPLCGYVVKIKFATRVMGHNDKCMYKDIYI